MGIRSVLAKPLAAFVVNRRRRWEDKPVETQEAWLQSLLNAGRRTAFGRDHRFSEIRTHDEFRQAVPLGDYEDLAAYVERVKAGEPDVLWPGKPAYFAKTSGTTSGVKYIPLSKESTPYHFSGARDATLSYVHETGKADFLDKKLIFLSGSPAHQ